MVYIFPAPFPSYAESLLIELVNKSSSEPYKKRLIRAMKKFLRCIMKHLTDDEFVYIFTTEFISAYIDSVGLDIVDFARIVMEREDERGLPLGVFPITWTEAIGEALYNMSWLWHSSRMSPEQFEKLYPRLFFFEYAKLMGFDKLGLNEP
jgi:hypothetical protein